jgi:hypothetical protein
VPASTFRSVLCQAAVTRPAAQRQQGVHDIDVDVAQAAHQRVRPAGPRMGMELVRQCRVGTYVGDAPAAVVCPSHAAVHLQHQCLAVPTVTLHQSCLLSVPTHRCRGFANICAPGLRVMSTNS